LRALVDDYLHTHTVLRRWGTLSWSSHWFFFNRRLKRILFVMVWARSRGMTRWGDDDFYGSPEKLQTARLLQVHERWALVPLRDFDLLDLVSSLNPNRSFATLIVLWPDKSKRYRQVKSHTQTCVFDLRSREAPLTRIYVRIGIMIRRY
jgi:hypothetical protein